MNNTISDRQDKIVYLTELVMDYFKLDFGNAEAYWLDDNDFVVTIEAPNHCLKQVPMNAQYLFSHNSSDDLSYIVERITNSAESQDLMDSNHQFFSIQKMSTEEDLKFMRQDDEYFAKVADSLSNQIIATEF